MALDFPLNEHPMKTDILGNIVNSIHCVMMDYTESRTFSGSRSLMVILPKSKIFERIITII